MRKGVYGYQLGRTRNQRQALFRSLTCALVEKGKVQTTLAKAKAVKGRVEKLITKAKRGHLADRRIIFRFLNKRSLVNKLVSEIAPQLKERGSGYLKIVRLGIRKGDSTKMAQIAFVDELSALEKPVKEEAPKKGKEGAK